MVRDSAPPKVETLARLAGRWTSGNGVTILAKAKQEPLTRLLVAAESGKEDKASYNEDSEEVGVVGARPTHRNRQTHLSRKARELDIISWLDCCTGLVV